MDVSSLLALSGVGIYLHAVFVSITLGFPLAIIALLYKYSKTGDEDYFKAAKKMTAILAVNFALGAVTGTLVEFGLVQAWSGVIFAIASFVLAPLALELIAFANEIALLVLFIATLGRVRASTSIAILFAYWIFAVLSGVLITAANSWLVVPWGTGNLASVIYPFMPEFGDLNIDVQKIVALKVLLLSGVPLHEIISAETSAIGVVLNDPYVSLYSSFTFWSVVHNVAAASIVGLAIALAAWLYRGNVKIGRTFFPILFALILIQPTIFGHFMGVEVAKYNPTKFAMMENAVETKINPLVAFLAYGDASKPIIGFNDFYEECMQKDERLGEVVSAVGLSKEKIVALAKDLNLKVDESKIDSTLNVNLKDVCISDVKNAEKRMVLVHTLYYTKIAAGILSFLTSFLIFGMFYNVPIVTGIAKKLKLSLFHLALIVLLGVVTSASFGWAVREIGRKPWTVYGLLYPEELVNIVGFVTSPAFAVFMILVITSIGAFGLISMLLIARRW